jgi:hypothetical protein
MQNEDLHTYKYICMHVITYIHIYIYTHLDTQNTHLLIDIC